VYKNSPLRILIDASHDGGVWWYPQSSASDFSSSTPHQGKELADFIRGRGFQVDELPRGTTITDSLLSQYDKVIRAGYFFHYSEPELAAYDAFLQRRTSLFLISEFQRVGQSDGLAERLGIHFAGAAVFNASGNSSIEILGWLSDTDYVDLNDNGRQDADEPTGAPVMGTLHHSHARIFFLGEINGLEGIPQPFVTNLVGWLFDWR